MNHIELSFNEMVKQCIYVLKAGLVPHLIGSPGEGKSAVASYIADKWNLFLIDERLSTADPTDQKGLPGYKGDKASYIPFDTFPLEGDPIPEGYSGFLLNLDELDSASRAVVASAYKTILDRMIGNKKLHPKLVIMTAGNSANDNAIVNEIGTAMQSRLVNLYMGRDVPQFIDFMTEQRWDSRIIGFIGFQPSLLNNFEPDHSDANFACQRTWEFVNKLLKKNPKATAEEMLPAIAGSVGQGVAQNFLAYCDYYSSLPKFEDMIRDPLGCPLPDEPGIHWAAATLVGERADQKTIGPALEFLQRMDIDLELVGAKMVYRRCKSELIQTKEFRDWMRQRSEEFITGEN